MNKFGRGMLTGLIAGCALAGSSINAVAQTGDYPNKLVRIICVTAPGGGIDVMSRLVADRLTRTLGQSVIVDNRAGAGGNIGSEYAAKSAPDGYTLVATANNHIINWFIYKNPGYDPRKDFAAVAELAEGPSILITGAKSPYRSLKDVIDAARTEPGKLVYGSSGNGSATNIQGEMLKKAANVNITHVPYKGGGPANQDVLAGQIPLAMADPSAVMQHLQVGTLRALAITSAKRWPGLPDVPTIAESGYPGFSHMTWIGLLAPAGTPPAIVNRLNKEIADILNTADIRERIITLGRMPVGRSPADFEAMLKADFEATGKIISEIGLKVD
jgi:tripartite-type tricarboxylate transporter receptor subunit TctC